MHGFCLYTKKLWNAVVCCLSLIWITFPFNNRKSNQISTQTFSPDLCHVINKFPFVIPMFLVWRIFNSRYGMLWKTYKIGKRELNSVLPPYLLILWVGELYDFFRHSSSNIYSGWRDISTGPWTIKKMGLGGFNSMIFRKPPFYDAGTMFWP